MIRPKKNILPLNREQYRAEVKKIKKDHLIVIAAVSEHGEFPLKELTLMYINTLDEDKQLFVDELRKGLKLIRSGNVGELKNYGKL